MSATTDNRVASLLGLLGAGLLILQAIIDLVTGVVYLAIGHGAHAFGSLGQTLILLVVGLIVAFFAVVDRRRREERSLVTGVVLIVLALAGWLILGFTGNVFGLLATILVLLSGIVYVLAGR